MPDMGLTITEDAGYHLRVWRAERGLTATEAARRLNISPSHLSLIEAGRRVPSPKVAKRIATRTGASLEVILGLAQPKQRTERW